MSTSVLLKQVKALKAKHVIEPDSPITYSEEWQTVKEFELGFLEHRFPDAYQALLAGYEKVELEDRTRNKPLGGRTKGKIPWVETKQGRWHMLTCELGWYGVLWDHHDACIAMADEIGRLEAEQHE
jgi:hypothetical protein